MKVQVLDDTSAVVFASDDPSPAIATRALKTEIAGALNGAAANLLSDAPIIAAIRNDIRAVVGRIEHELGAHPAFTWAQTKLSNAAAHLEHYLAGDWTEPTWPVGVAHDDRGMIVSTAAGVIGNPNPAPVAPNVPHAADTATAV